MSVTKNRETFEEKAARQELIEETFKTEAIERSRKAVLDALENGRATELTPVQRLLNAAYDGVSARIDELKASKTRGVGAKYRGYIRLVSSDVLTVMTLNTLLNNIASTELGMSSIQSLGTSLGRAVQSEIIAQNAEVVAPAYMNRVYEYLKEHKTRSQSHILRTFRAASANVKLETDPWDNTTCFNVGRLLLQCVHETGIFEWVQGPKGLLYAEPAEELQGVFSDVLEHADTMVHYPPMIVPPVRHEDIYNGGYLTDLSRRHTYSNRHIKRSRLREVNEAFKQATGIRQALNKAQEVPYVVNKSIYDLVLQAKATGFDIGIPSHHQKPQPKFHLHGTDKETWSEADQEAFEVWKTQMRQWYTKERKRVSQIRQLAITLDLCRRFMDEDALYFPTCVDWRYRLYFKSHLNPQGSDIQKALLLLGRKKKLGKRGLFWLKSHVATCFGFDKPLFEQRVAWTDERIDAIREWVKDPLNNEDFKDADEFWCMLAASTQLIEALDSGDPENYESNIAVALDATNSGGQHFSAMLRDPVGGKLTNLFWDGNLTKADLYMDVKQRTDSKIKVALRDPETIVQAHYWTLNPITRSMTKRPTMTYFYSATLRSCTDYIFLGAADEGYEGTDEYTLFKLCSFVSPLMRDSINEAMPAAARGMDYLKAVCQRVPMEKHLQWKTVLGGLVINRYCNRQETRVKVRSMGINQVVLYNFDYERNHRQKAVSGISPNFIHQGDSSHLMMTILNFDGDIIPIHDSVATHACDVDDLHRVLREQFFILYTEHQNPLEVIRDAALEAGADLEGIEMPPMGTLNLELVKDSPFFFC
ncbi:DNA-directed RNA polymerase [Vibrio phage vB_VpaP_M9]|nr:DNA-directed RNA polymerase [Vibrio phage vB_VpaP_M83]USL89828.1 DNA-directed RNA polymerase [Vibrio phage vB_VpaP_M9]